MTEQYQLVDTSPLNIWKCVHRFLLKNTSSVLFTLTGSELDCMKTHQLSTANCSPPLGVNGNNKSNSEIPLWQSKNHDWMMWEPQWHCQKRRSCAVNTGLDKVKYENVIYFLPNLLKKKSKMTVWNIIYDIIVIYSFCVSFAQHRNEYQYYCHKIIKKSEIYHLLFMKYIQNVAHGG